jgi:hypothetical protein
MAHEQDHMQHFHYVPTQGWGRATRDYEKFMHKKPSFNMARKEGSEISNLIFSINSHYNVV